MKHLLFFFTCFALLFVSVGTSQEKRPSPSSSAKATPAPPDALLYREMLNFQRSEEQQLLAAQERQSEQLLKSAEGEREWVTALLGVGITFLALVGSFFGFVLNKTRIASLEQLAKSKEAVDNAKNRLADFDKALNHARSQLTKIQETGHQLSDQQEVVSKSLTDLETSLRKELQDAHTEASVLTACIKVMSGVPSQINLGVINLSNLVKQSGGGKAIPFLLHIVGNEAMEARLRKTALSGINSVIDRVLADPDTVTALKNACRSLEKNGRILALETMDAIDANLFRADIADRSLNDPDPDVRETGRHILRENSFPVPSRGGEADP